MPKKKRTLDEFRIPKLNIRKPDWFDHSMRQEEAAFNSALGFGLDVETMKQATGMKDWANAQEVDESVIGEDNISASEISTRLIQQDKEEALEDPTPYIRRFSESLFDNIELDGAVRSRERKKIPPSLINYLAFRMIERCYTFKLSLPFALVELLEAIFKIDRFGWNHISKPGSDADIAESKIISFCIENWDLNPPFSVIAEFAGTSTSQVAAVLKREKEFIEGRGRKLQRIEEDDFDDFEDVEAEMERFFEHFFDDDAD